MYDWWRLFCLNRARAYKEVELMLGEWVQIQQEANYYDGTLATEAGITDVSLALTNLLCKGVSRLQIVMFEHTSEHCDCLLFTNKYS